MDWYQDVFDIVFPNVDAKQVNDLWKDKLKEPAKDSKKDVEVIEDVGFHSTSDI